MYEIDFNKPLHIHFIGIGGISMSGLAEILLKEDFKISGSDAKPSDLVTHLESLGAKVYIGQRASNITDDIELVIYTAAIHPDNPEFACAKEKQIPMLTRAELLGQIMRNYETPIQLILLILFICTNQFTYCLYCHLNCFIGIMYHRIVQS